MSVREFVTPRAGRYTAVMQKFFLVTIFAVSGLAATGCLPPVDYKEENRFQNDLAAEHNNCVLSARQSCEGESDFDACVANSASSCVGRTASTPDPYRQSILPSGVEDSYANPNEAIGLDPDLNPGFEPGVDPDR